MFAVSFWMRFSASRRGRIASSKIKNLKGASQKRRGAIMYLRFVTPLIHPDSGVESGFFRAAWYLDRIDCPDWIRSELDGQFGWFNQNLPIPRRVARHFARRNSLHGVGWFRSAARECIDRARYCAWLISEGGLPVETIKAREARDLIWRDEHQIVMPSRAVPRAFSGRPLDAGCWA